MYKIKYIFTLLCLCYFVTGIAASNEDYTKHIVHTKGQTYLDNFPHVEQKKNYCGPASVEMILRYFDDRINQQKLARIFDSSKKSGTNAGNILDAFGKGKLDDFTIKEHYSVFRKKHIYDMIIAYNKHVNSSKKLKKTKPKEGDFSYKNLQKMNPAVARQVFSKHHPEEALKFAATIKDTIDNGIPVLWSIFTFLDPRDPMDGGHFRVIIGYMGINAETIIYVDPWGKVQRRKNMTFNDAWAITKSYYTITPITHDDTK